MSDPNTYDEGAGEQANFVIFVRFVFKIYPARSPPNRIEWGTTYSTQKVALRPLDAASMFTYCSIRTQPRLFAT